MTKIRMMLAAVVLATGCATPPPPPPAPTAAEKAAAPKGTCFCNSSACLCSHCGTGKGDCTCKR
ncbi:MAG TPA: hypothetical protein VKW04_06470 [Planctomycetota bacterium]|jgi:hypothetical protein|nr:hypothetical protein [Planctomycetota bacterium]